MDRPVAHEAPHEEARREKETCPVLPGPTRPYPFSTLSHAPYPPHPPRHALPSTRTLSYGFRNALSWFLKCASTFRSAPPWFPKRVCMVSEMRLHGSRNAVMFPEPWFPKRLAPNPKPKILRNCKLGRSSMGTWKCNSAMKWVARHNNAGLRV